MPEFIEIQREFRRALLQIPTMDRYDSRSALLQGLPPVALLRSEGDKVTDLNLIIGGLEQLGRLTDEGGTRPLIVVANNALELVSSGGEVAEQLQKVKRLLAEYYGGDVQNQIVPAPQDLEALVFGRSHDNRLAYAFVEGARRTARGVTRLAVPRVFEGVQQSGGMYGTGWLIAPGVVITNHHVIEARDAHCGEPPATAADLQAQAGGVEAWFDFYQETGGEPIKCRGACLLACNRQLDYAGVELAEAHKLADRSPLPIIAQPPNLVRGSRVNLVQHAGGGALQYAIRNNFFVRSGDTPQFIRYQTDTEPGASGSPVCDDSWQVIGLHHASTPVPAQMVPQEVLNGNPVTVTLLNEAIAIHAILDDLPPEVKQRILAPRPQ